MKQKTLKDLNQSSTMEKGSGSDANSDISRLSHSGNRQDKMDEDSFPASDAPSSYSVGRGDQKPAKAATGKAGELPADFKDNKAAQFAYGRKSEAATLHFDTSTNRLEQGNPDVGDIDLGVIDAESPVRADDNNPYTRPDSRSHNQSNDTQAVQKADRMADRAERRADVDQQNEY